MMTRKKSFYSPEFKIQAISLVRDASRSASEVARELGINVNTLYNWLSSVTDKSIKNPANDAILAENKRLKKALAQAELERDILKKAAAYFAKEIQ
jgi:transposase